MAMKEILKYMSNKNIRRGPVTTIVGTVIILASLFSVFYLPEVGWLEASPGLLIGILLGFVKDPKSAA